MNTKNLIAGLFKQHTDKEMIRFEEVLKKAGFIPVAACRGHRPILSSWIFHLELTTPFYGWPPFLYFSGDGTKARELYRRIREEIAASTLSEDWRMIGVFSPVGGRLDWLLFNPGVFSFLFGMEYPIRFRHRLKKDLRIIESLLEGLGDIVPETLSDLFDVPHENPSPALDGRILFPSVPTLQNDIKKEHTEDQNHSAPE